MSQKLWLCVLGALGTFTGASAQDARLVCGGIPEPLAGHPAIQMESVKIKLKIGRSWTAVTCACVLHNAGPAKKVLVGFPEQMIGPTPAPEADPSEDPPKSRFSSFQAYVDGKKTATKLSGGADSETSNSDDSGDTGSDANSDPKKAAISWRQKYVSFKKGQTVYILNQFRVHTGRAIAGKASIQQVGFVLHTGASWSGPIKNVTVLAEFDEGMVSPDLKASPARLLHVKWATDYTQWDKVNPHRVYYHAFGAPKVDDPNLLFVAHDLTPSKRSDLYLYFKSPSTKKKRLYKPEETEQ